MDSVMKAEEGFPTSDFRLPTSDFRLPTSNFWLPTSDFRLQTSDFRPKTSYFKLQTSDLTKFELRISDFLPLRLNAAWLDYEPPASHFPLLTSDFRLPTSDFQLPTSDFGILGQARLVLNPDNLTGDFTWSKIAADDWKRTRLLTTWHARRPFLVGRQLSHVHTANGKRQTQVANQSRNGKWGNKNKGSPNSKF